MMWILVGVMDANASVEITMEEKHNDLTEIIV